MFDSFQCTIPMSCKSSLIYYCKCIIINKKNRIGKQSPKIENQKPFLNSDLFIFLLIKRMKNVIQKKELVLIKSKINCPMYLKREELAGCIK